MESEFDISEEYGKFKEKYGLPEFEKLSEDFDIERIGEHRTSFILREIRKMMNEKIVGYLHLCENLINPTGPPMLIFSIIRNLKKEDKEIIKEIYKGLSLVQIKVMKIDVIYSEESEAKFIRETFDQWQKLKPKISGLIEKFDENFESEDYKRENGYFN